MGVWYESEGCRGLDGHNMVYGECAGHWLDYGSEFCMVHVLRLIIGHKMKSMDFCEGSM